MSAGADFYAVLGVPRDASMAEIKKAYRALIEPWDEMEAERNAREEWNQDVARGAATMSGEVFKDAIFEVKHTAIESVAPRSLLL